MLSSPAFELEQWIQTHTQTHTERHSRVASDRHILIFICNAISLSLPHIASQPNKCTHTYMQTQNVVIPLAAPNYEMYGWMMIVWCTVSSMVYSPHRVSVALIAYTVECVAMRSLQIGFAHNVCLACVYGPIPRETVIMHVYSNAGIGSYQPLVLWTVYACVYCAPMACVCVRLHGSWFGCRGTGRCARRVFVSYTIRTYTHTRARTHTHYKYMHTLHTCNMRLLRRRRPISGSGIGVSFQLCHRMIPLIVTTMSSVLPCRSLSRNRKATVLSVLYFSSCTLSVCALFDIFREQQNTIVVDTIQDNIFIWKAIRTKVYNIF